MQTSSQRGFFLIEVIVASSIISVVLILLIGSIQRTVEVSQRALERTQAAYLLEETGEATKLLRDTSWNTISNLSPSTTYYPLWDGSSWSFSTVSNTVGIFTRSITVDSVYRNAHDDIAASGTVDAGTKLVTAYVRWSTPTGQQSKTLSFYISNIRE